MPGICREEVISVAQLPQRLEEIVWERENRRGCRWSAKKNLTKQILAFDIETTNIDTIADLCEDELRDRATSERMLSDKDARVGWVKQGVMYHWQLQVGFEFTVIGRTWAEFRTAIDAINVSLERKNAYIVGYIHNLKFEFSYLAGQWKFLENDVMVMGPRDPLRCQMGRIDWRCSYHQTGMGLDALTRKYNVAHPKSVGDLDYSQMRWPWTPLSPEEIGYCLNDVRGLVEAMDARREETGDTWYTIPLTKTGYVRRKSKQALSWRTKISRIQQSDYEVYLKLRQAFRGGNTHANRFCAESVLKDVTFADRSSSYPDVMLNEVFPTGNFHKIDPDKFTEIYKKAEYACLLTIAMRNVELRSEFWPVPYISLSKCRNVVGAQLDNGRIISADYLETTITDIDWDIIQEEYKVENGWECMELYVSRYEPLPPQLTLLVVELYKAKTELKGVEGREAEYNRAKEDLNSLYGMCVQDPGKSEWVFARGHDFEQSDIPGVDNYLARVRNTPLLYAWGVWITAWARYRLEEGIRLAGYQFVYCDTDSIAYQGVINWEAYNEIRKQNSILRRGYATDPKGNTHYMGVYEPDKFCESFITFGAKKYAYVENGNVKITIAGVGKRSGAVAVVEAAKRAGLEHNPLQVLRRDFVFDEASGGGTESVYNDDGGITLRIKCVDGTVRVLECPRNVYIGPSTYQLGVSDDYNTLLQFVRGHLWAYRDRLAEQGKTSWAMGIDSILK